MISRNRFVLSFISVPVILATAVALDSRATADDFAVRFSDRSNVEIKNSANLLDLNEDFTIEVWARWRPSARPEIIAGDEAWPEMAKEVKVAEERGWVIRKLRIKDRDNLDFTVGTNKGGWFGISAPLPRKMPAWSHIAICRKGNKLSMFLDGKHTKSATVEGRKLLPSPSPIYLGVQKYAHTERKFDGQIRGFRISTDCRYTKNFSPPETLVKEDATEILYTFAHASGDVAKDESGNGHDGKLTGADFVPCNVK